VMTLDLRDWACWVGAKESHASRDTSDNVGFLARTDARSMKSSLSHHLVWWWLLSQVEINQQHVGNGEAEQFSTATLNNISRREVIGNEGVKSRSQK